MDCTTDGDSDVEAYGAGTYELLVSGDLKVMSDEGSYRCPFCSDAKKGYNLHDLLQHASGVGAAHDREAEEKSDHRALLKHLKGKVSESPGSVFQPTLTDPQAPQHNRDEQFVWPWMGILVNMPNEYFGKSANRLKEHFSCFHPVKVHPVYNKGSPTRNAIIEFGKDWSGFRNARAFESHFAMKGYGKNYWKEMKCGGTEPVGWVARADDYNSLGAIGEILRKNGDLKTFSDIENEGTNKTDKLLANLAYQVREKEMHLEELECEYNKRAASLDLMMEKREQLLQSYTQEIMNMRQLSQKNTQRVVDENQKLRSDLQGMMDELDARSKQIKELAARTGRDLELEKQKNAMKANHLRLAALEQQKAAENVVKLLEEQEREKAAALEKLRRLNVQMDTKHNLELEIKHLMGKLQVMEIKPGAEDSESRNRIAELREELNDKIDELKDMQSYNQALIDNESKYRDELREAREALVEALQVLPGTTMCQTQIGIKRIGELDPKAFLNMCKRKFPEEDAEAESAILCSKWQNEINNPEWRPFKVVMVNGKESKVLREDDEKLQELKEYGEEPYAAVIKVLIELNGSGRNPSLELWNYEEGRKAQMKEAVQHALELWKASKAKGMTRR
ncbi:factor of DNA methylation 1-like [Phragmites australis]|uniref:factor of DNA methylation 1-like n=1 Tax=Phragmites australis TaxID=29695 RepID=UPI002D77E1AA|nr:factor of DNA methylation 1-like [Phragmites australis]